MITLPKHLQPTDPDLQRRAVVATQRFAMCHRRRPGPKDPPRGPARLVAAAAKTLMNAAECGNRRCHRQLTTEGPMKKRSARDNYLRIVDYLGGRCYDCKRVFPIYVYDVHCPDERRKDFSFADIPKLKPFDEIKDHLDNCVLLCCNCHRIRHYNEGK